MRIYDYMERIMNLNKLKMYLKKNSIVDTITRIIYTPIFKYQYNKFTREATMRKNGTVSSPKYDWIKGYKNKYVGKRCFVVATGPSLTIKDLDQIKNEYTFSMNSIILSFDKTSWRPDFYVIQDEYVYEKIEDALLETYNRNLNEIFVGGIIADKFNIPSNFKQYPLHVLDHKMFHLKDFGEFRFSDDCYSCIYDGYTVTFSILQLAVYMGFKEIYLLGCDCNYNNKKSHFIDYGHKDPKACIMGDKMIYIHTELKKYADKHNIKIVNCTRGGMLEVYPRKNLEDVLINDERIITQ